MPRQAGPETDAGYPGGTESLRLIKEADGLIGTVGAVNTALVAERRTQMA